MLALWALSQTQLIIIIIILIIIIIIIIIIAIIIDCSLDKNTYLKLQDKKIKSSAKLQIKDNNVKN